MGDFRMPALGADMEAGTLARWLKAPGDRVHRGDIIAIVDTQKGAIDVEVFEDGVVERLEVEPGRTVPVGTVLATIHTAPGATAATAPVGETSSAPPTSPPRTPAAGPMTAAASTTPPTAPRHARVSPLARRLAADLGVDLEKVTGTGEGGAITRDDVERALASSAREAPGDKPASGSAGMRAAIANAMSRAKREIPHYYLSTTIDMGAALSWLAAENAKRPMDARLLPAALLVKAVALGLRDVPDLNGYWIDGGFRPGAGIHVGCAISLRGGGLVAPAIHDADRLDIGALMRTLQDLVARARAGTLRSSELSDPTITLTNLGELGVDATFGIIYPPQVALVGFGRIAERPWVVDGTIAARPIVETTLSADHRATDGHRGGRLLAAIDRRLQSPERL